MYSAGFYPFPTLEEYWAYWSRHIYYNRYDLEKNKVYSGLLEIVKNKDYFIITTNVDHQFQLAQDLTKKGFSIHKGTTDYGSAQSHATRKHMTMKRQ